MEPYDFDLIQGDTFSLTFRIKDIAGEVVDVQDAEFHCQGRYGIKGCLAFDVSSDDDGIVINNDNTIVISLDAETTALFKVQNISYDIKMVLSEVRSTIMEGTITIDPEVTVEEIVEEEPTP